MTTATPRSRWVFVGASVVAVLIGLYALFCAVMSAWMGIGSIIERGQPLPGLIFVALSSFAVWYVFALFASLWFRRDGLHIGSGLFFGLVILLWFVSMFGHEAYIRVTHSGTWTAKTYFELLLLGPVLVLSLILTGILLFRPSLLQVASLNPP